MMGSNTEKRLGLFEGIGVEIEYMIVDKESYSVAPACDRLMDIVDGSSVTEIERDKMAWSNELALHVLEIKTNGPAPSTYDLAEAFHRELVVANEHLSRIGTKLLPGSMHPWMDPTIETRLWPHEYNDIYKAYDRIFDCRGHGWANLQSVHINLPFSNDDEFERLHSAIRMVLPLLPGVAASSPFQEGRVTGWMDTRLCHYFNNQKKIPSVAGAIIPEYIKTQSEYEEYIYRPLEEAIAPHDPDNVLEPVFLNSRGAIARFDRGAIEIRLLDSQECPLRDIAVVEIVTRVVKAFVEGKAGDTQRFLSVEPSRARGLLDEVAKNAEQGVVRDQILLRAYGINTTSITIQELWYHLAESAGIHTGENQDAMKLLKATPLARRMLNTVGEDPSRESLKELCTILSECLEKNIPFSS